MDGVGGVGGSDGGTGSGGVGGDSDGSGNVNGTSSNDSTVSSNASESNDSDAAGGTDDDTTNDEAVAQDQPSNQVQNAEVNLDSMGWGSYFGSLTQSNLTGQPSDAQDDAPAVTLAQYVAKSTNDLTTSNIDALSNATPKTQKAPAFSAENSCNLTGGKPVDPHAQPLGVGITCGKDSNATVMGTIDPNGLNSGAVGFGVTANGKVDLSNGWSANSSGSANFDNRGNLSGFSAKIGLEHKF